MLQQPAIDTLARPCMLTVQRCEVMLSGLGVGNGLLLELRWRRGAGGRCLGVVWYFASEKEMGARKKYEEARQLITTC